MKAVDYEVSKVREKVKKDSEHLSDSLDFIKSQKITELNDKIAITLSQMEALGNEGKVNESIELSKTVSELQRKKQDLEVRLNSFQINSVLLNLLRTSFEVVNRPNNVCASVKPVVPS